MKIIDIVSNYYNIPKLAILSKNRLQRLVEPRHMICLLYRELTDLSLSEVGRIIDRDHCSVIHGVKAIQNRIDTEKKIRRRYADLKQIINGINQNKLVDAISDLIKL